MLEKIKTRLFVEQPLAEGAALTLQDAPAHYLLHTLRARPGDAVALFNGHDGEWLASIAAVHKKAVELQVESRRSTQKNAPDIWLAFAPVKNEKIDFMVKRAVELGVNALLPVITQRTVVSRLNMERLRANAVEAAEQCGRMDIPVLHEAQPLDKLLAAWPVGRMLIHCDESGAGAPVKTLLPTLAGPCAVLTGPEGGFSPGEQRMIAHIPNTKGLSLGPRVLRAETAALAALANVQAWLGDWAEPPHFIPEAI